MDVRTYRARTMQEALVLVRRELGPQAAVLHTRELGGGPLLRWIPGLKQIEITASAHVVVPSRLPPRDDGLDLAYRPPIARSRMPANAEQDPGSAQGVIPERDTSAEHDPRAELGQHVQGQLSELQAMVEDLCRRSRGTSQHDWPEELFVLFTSLIDAEVGEDLARELVERVRAEAPRDELSDGALVRARLLRMVEEQIQVAGPIRVTPGQRRLVALVGQTGVGKTTTIAKLAANFRLREKRKVGLITVDTYRIAAVEQLRTYADIIDLPMQVVSTPREMRQAVERMADLDLVLLDTAGRSPKDEVKIQELKAFLSEAGADEVHLVLSSVASSATLRRAAEQFSAVGTTAVLLTKLDEAAGLGNLLPLLRTCKLPLSYLTDGQVVPDDIAPADRHRLARIVLGMDESGN